MTRTTGFGVASLAVAALLWMPGSAQAGDSFWYGGDMPPVPAEHADMVHEAIVDGYLHTLRDAVIGFRSTEPWEHAGVVYYDPPRTDDGYTLLSSLAPYFVPGEGVFFSILVDMDGNVVNKWPYFGFPAKMLPGGYVMAGGGGGRDAHQEQGVLLQADWCGNPVWAWDGFHSEEEGGARWHHDFQREGNPVGYYAPGQKPLTNGGKTLVLAHDDPPESETQHISDIWPIEDDAIHEVDWEGNVVWSWYAADHYYEMGFDAEAQEAVRTIKVGAPENIGGGFPGTDWQHINSVSYLGPNVYYDQGDERFHPDNIIWDGRSSNIIAIIARHDHPDGDWQSGDLVWRVGPNYDPGAPEYALGQIIGQHHAHMIPRGLPGAGNILLFDNGGLAGFGPLFPGLTPWWPNTWRSYSRVIEFNPQTLEIVWSYEQPAEPEADGDPRKFFSWFISGAQRLQNGNTLITDGAHGRVFEVTQDGEIVWEYLSPFGFPGGGFGRAIYRAYRVPKQWIPQNPKCVGD